MSGADQTSSEAPIPTWRRRLRLRSRVEDGGRAAVVAALVALVAGAAGWALMAFTETGDRLESTTLDWRWRLRGEQPPDPRIVLVAIDEESLDRRELTFPLPRSVHATVIRRLTRLDARAVMYDVELGRRGPTRRDDDALLAAIADAPPLVLPATRVYARGPRFLGGDLENRKIAGVSFGGSVEHPDADGALRRFLLDVPALELPSTTAAARRAFDGARAAEPPDDPAWGDIPHEPCDLDNSPDRSGRYRCPTRAYSFGALLDDRIPRAAVAGKLVVVGYTGATMQTRRRTWAAAERQATPIELLAHQIVTVLEGFPLRTAGAWWSGLGLLLVVLTPILVAIAVERQLRKVSAPRVWRGTGAVVAAGALAAVAWAAATAAAFAGGRVLPLVPVVAACLAATAAVASPLGVRLQRRSRAVFATAASLAPEQVIELVVRGSGGRRLLRDTDEDRVPPREMTIMFGDLKNSTAYIQALDEPWRTYDFLQLFQRHVIDVVDGERGYVQSLEGDGFLAVFGGGFGGPDHAARAVRAARELTGDGLNRLSDDVRAMFAGHAEMTALLDERPLGMRVGVNTGEVAFGTSGRAAENGAASRYAFVTMGKVTHEAAKIMGTTRAERPGDFAPWAPPDWAGEGGITSAEQAHATILDRRPRKDEPDRERVVVASQATFEEALARGAGEVGVRDGFLPVEVRVGDGTASVWVLQGPRGAWDLRGDDRGAQPGDAI